MCLWVCVVSQWATLSIIFNRCFVCHVICMCRRQHSVGSVLITACGLPCLLEKKKKRKDSFRKNWWCLGNSGGRSGCGMCVPFLISKCPHKLCVSMCLWRRWIYSPLSLMSPFLYYYTAMRVNNSCVGSCFMVTAQYVSEHVQRHVYVCARIGLTGSV